MLTRKVLLSVLVFVLLTMTGTAFNVHTTDASEDGALPIRGVDVSTLQRAEDLDAKYYDENGRLGDPLRILRSHGVNYVRLRVWVNPANGYNNKDKVVQFAPQVKTHGMRLLIDLHYSDTWADPGHQTKPAAWTNDSFSQLLTDVYNYTYDVCNSLKAAHVTPDMIQLGNEINGGMLWPDGRWDQWDNLAALLKQGYNAVKACSPSTLVMLHIANAGDDGGARWWFDNAQSRGVQWDVTGLSYYSYWHGTLAAMSYTVQDMKARYGKRVVIAETAYPFTLAENDSETNVINSANQLTSGYPAMPKGQRDNLKDVVKTARAAGALGVFYWEPTWTAVPGNGWDPTNPSSGDGWENQALFDFNSRALPALNVFRPDDFRR
jgi:arabinogalactan endo-1,4-beta-galactosidase